MPRAERGHPDRERGAALLTVLLMVAIIAVLAAAGLEKLRLSTRIAGNAAATEQARAYALAAETLAIVRIDGLLRQQPDRITLAGGWSGHPFSLPLPGGIATARVTDGGNCLNLNGLVTQVTDGPAAGAYRAAPGQMAEFARLIRSQGTPGQLADTIAAATADWIDTDAVELPGGAEDGRYADGEQPYRTANTLMADPSELRAVAGVTPAIYASLRPYICTLPVPRPSTLNIDTLLPEQAPLVAMLAPDTIGVGQAQTALVARPPQGFASVGDFWKQAALAGGANTGEAQGRTGVLTRWFTLDIDVGLGGVTRLREHALVDATRLPPRLVSRQWGEDS
ncbi:type II secretion system minor pseudopilin GspK [Sphingomonas bacterium]|uniref:type II secretion system minor pseudopilin GspK n=1 Tax=Sphingomonas bacterium TaxID=1895847 RepID=UPI00157566DE|nr:type II secretion system minor pseudopilin GspK [Sphingomonas bacterium]